jgi:tRNA(Leu) C34 or U34 (ribose-2'-O)-methylase TrmL
MNETRPGPQPRQDEPRPPRLGIDIGRVIIDGSSHPHGGDTAFFDGDEATMLATPEMAGAVASIQRLVAAFGGQVWLVSKCGPRVQARTLRWLAGHDFTARTGLPADQVRFCRARPDKRRHCQELALTHFVDDRLDVHEAIHGTVDHQYLFGPHTGPLPRYVRHTPTWADAEHLILATLATA